MMKYFPYCLPVCYSSQQAIQYKQLLLQDTINTPLYNLEMKIIWDETQ